MSLDLVVSSILNTWNIFSVILSVRISDSIAIHMLTSQWTYRQQQKPWHSKNKSMAETDQFFWSLLLINRNTSLFYKENH